MIFAHCGGGVSLETFSGKTQLNTLYIFDKGVSLGQVNNYRPPPPLHDVLDVKMSKTIFSKIYVTELERRGPEFCKYIFQMRP